MEGKKPFVVVSTNSAKDFERDVNHYMSMGYVLHGEPKYEMAGATDSWGNDKRAIFRHSYFQALKLPTEATV